jgi:hypothetical protein
MCPERDILFFRLPKRQERDWNDGLPMHRTILTLIVSSTSISSLNCESRTRSKKQFTSDISSPSAVQNLLLRLFVHRALGMATQIASRHALNGTFSIKLLPTDLMCFPSHISDFFIRERKMSVDDWRSNIP